MGTTAKGLHYPAPTARIADGAAAIQTLAEDVDELLDTYKEGPQGEVGPPGGSDASFAGWVADDSSLTREQLDQLYASGNLRVATVDTLPTVDLWSAHSGSKYGLAPEGSFAAYDLVSALGAHILDADAQLTQDGIPINIHDATLTRVTDGTGNVADTPFRLLPQLSHRQVAGEGSDKENLAATEAFIIRYGGWKVLTIEAKAGVPGVAPLAALIKKYGLERSVLINTADMTVAAAVTAAGCLPHVFNVTTQAAVALADAAGAWLIEVPYNASTAIVNDALAATHIKRVIAGPIGRRFEKAAMTAGLHGYVNDQPGYLDSTHYRPNIALEIAKKRIGYGWWFPGSEPAPSQARFAASGNAGVVLSQGGTFFQWMRFGSLCGPKPAIYTITAKFRCSFTDANARASFRSHCTTDRGAGNDADILSGLAWGIRKNGSLAIWRNNANGTSTSLSAPTGTALTPGNTYTLTLETTATQVRLTCVETGATTGWITDAATRGDYVWASGCPNDSPANPELVLEAYSWA